MAIYELKTFSDILNSVLEEVKIQSGDTVTVNRIKRDINLVYINEVVPYANWKWLRGNTSITHEPYMSTGTCEVTSGSPVVTLSSAPTIGKKGLLFTVDGFNETYRIFQHSANSATVTLEVPYGGTSSATATYKIWADRIPLPAELRETLEITHAFKNEPLEGLGLQEFRRHVSTSPRAEGRPQRYSTTDYADPTSYSLITSLPATVSRSSSGLVRTVTCASNLANYLRESDRIEITGSSAYQYNGEYVVSSVSGTSFTYTARSAYDEASTADVALTIKAQNSELSARRYKELAVHPSLNSTRTTLNIDFIKETTPLEDDSDEPLMPIGDRAVLVYGALSKAWARERNPQEATRNAALYERKLERMEGKIDDSTDFPQLKPSRTFLAAKRSSIRTRNSRYGFFDGGSGGGGGSGSSTGTANRVAEFDSSGLLTSDSLISVTELQQLNGVGSAVSGISDTATLTNKTIAVASNSITSSAVNSVAYFDASGLLTGNAGLTFVPASKLVSGPKSLLLGLGEAATFDALVYVSRTDAAAIFAAGTSATSGRNIVCYGSTHATKASVLEIRSGSTTHLSMSSAGLVGVGGATDSAKGFRVGSGSSAAVSNGTSGIVQVGIGSEITCGSDATTYLAGMYSASTTLAASFTCGLRVGYYSDDATKGSGSTITRDVGYYLNQPTQGTNNASIADNAAFSGNYFINSTSTRASLFSGVVNHSAGLRTKVAVTDTANPPTQAELVTAFGAAATVGAGFMGLLNDNAGGTNEYLVWSDGTNFFYVAGTIGA